MRDCSFRQVAPHWDRESNHRYRWLTSLTYVVTMNLPWRRGHWIVAGKVSGFLMRGCYFFKVQCCLFPSMYDEFWCTRYRRHNNISLLTIKRTRSIPVVDMRHNHLKILLRGPLTDVWIELLKEDMDNYSSAEYRVIYSERKRRLREITCLSYYTVVCMCEKTKREKSYV